jgi:hypothetical protein
LSSDNPNDGKKSSIGGWKSNRGLIISVPLVLVGVIFIMIIIVGLGTYYNVPSPPVPSSPAVLSNESLSVITDKNSYHFGDYVKVSGTLAEPVQGKTVRLDIYNSEGDVFTPFNDSVSGYIPQSDIQVKPNDKGLFSYQFLLGPIVLENVTGIYKIEATYGDVTKNATFRVR